MTADRNTYLKEECSNASGTFYKCPYSNEYYLQNYTDSCWRQEYTEICSNDPGNYQACGHYPCSEYTSEELLCGTYMCHNKKWHKKGTYRSGEFNKGNKCNGVFDCYNTELDETNCDFEHVYRCNDKFQTTIDADFVCDMKCDCLYCEDEALCKGIEYGVHCTWKNGNYRTPNAVCDNSTLRKLPSCSIVDEDALCLEENAIRTCRTEYRGEEYQRYLLPLHICAVEHNSAPVCTDGRDQLNCSDTTRISLNCTMNSEPTSVSSFGICKNYQRICDDDYQNYCVEPEGGCIIHKNQLCDGYQDCRGGSDEAVGCQQAYMSSTTCIRRVAMPKRGTITMQPLAIPMAWVFDGIADCQNEVDETESYWKRCNNSIGVRYIERHKDCDDIFVCPYNENFIEQHDLCDKIESCTGENAICSISRGTFDVLTVAPSSVYNGNLQDTYKVLLHCHRGLEELYKHDTLGECNFTTFKRVNALGVTADLVYRPTWNTITTAPCSYMYGELYVYNNCVKLPLIPHDACINTPKARIYTLTVDNKLTIVKRFRNHYKSIMFACRNKNCIPFSMVCNLADDCGDGSDEEECVNSFNCMVNNATAANYIPLSRVCDGKVDCKDATDECNDKCKINIIDTITLELTAWVFGFFAIMFNLIVLVKSGSYLTSAESVVKLMNKVMILLIASGDFLMGVYLSGIAIANVTSRRYCQDRYQWLTSTICACLGVLSTTAAQLSLLSITVLSIFRVHCLNSVRYIGRESLTPRKQLVIFVIAVMVLTIGITISVIPLLPGVEDYFVNGIYYPDSFLFLGTVDKALHYKVFEKYYGRVRKDGHLSWYTIENMVKNMYTGDYGGIKSRKLHFYGNDGVCLFKYMVTSSDPQVAFSISVLFANFTCFLIVSCCYIVIEFRASKSLLQVCSDNRELLRRNRKLQTKISVIILTDFLCWVPFILTCMLHLTEVIDATSFYPVFSIVILPLNSVINPVLYDPTVAKIVSKPYMLVANTSGQIANFFKGSSECPCMPNEGNRQKRIDPITHFSVPGGTIESTSY